MSMLKLQLTTVTVLNQSFTQTLFKISIKSIFLKKQSNYHASILAKQGQGRALQGQKPLKLRPFWLLTKCFAKHYNKVH